MLFYKYNYLCYMEMKELYHKYQECGYKVTTDSRAISGGEIFFALRGENFDGNDYALKALEAGAAWAVVNDDIAADDPRFIRVADPFTTLQQLAIYHRNNVHGDKHLPVVGLTGTNGKTTTKELIAAVLSKKYRVCATQGNLNNDIGVPLSLLKIRPDTEIAVIEMGASHPDDIAKLVKVSQPDYGLITNVGKAHLLGFGSFEGVKTAKGELYYWLGSHEGSLIFLNENDADLREMASAQPCHCFGYGMKYQGAELLPSSAEQPFVRLRLGSDTISTKLIGGYNATNILAAMAVGEYFGVSRADAIAAIEAYTPSNGRSQMTRTASNTLIVDAYNANPSSMKSALDNFATAEAGFKVAMLGDMRELGADSVKEHVAIVSKLADMVMTRQLDRIYLVGDEFNKALAEFSGKNLTLMTMAGPAFFYCGTSEELAGFLKENPVDGALILIKGSRGIQMEKTIPSL